MLLLHASRRSGRRSQPILLALHGVQASKPLAAPIARCLSSASLEGGASAVSPSNIESVVTPTGEKLHWRTIAWEKKIFAALRAYKQIYGDTWVKISFVVPVGDSRWPQVAWGYRLGDAVSILRRQARKQQLAPRVDAKLKEMGFVYGSFQYRWDVIILPALRCYSKLHDNTDVPQRFVVPDGDESWPRRSWGLALGSTVNNIRRQKAYQQQVLGSRAELDEMGFCYDITLTEREWTEAILPSLKVFHQEFDHCLVSRNFVVPSKLPWPHKAWGMRLGTIVNQIRSGANYFEEATRDRDVLIQLGFSWDYYRSNWEELIFPAIEVCAAEYGHLRPQIHFRVPPRDPWSKKVWNMALGQLLYMMRYNGYYFPYLGRDSERLLALGFPFELTRRAWDNCVAPLLEIYAELFGDTSVPHDFVIPSESPWPERMWGVHLGIFVVRNAQYLGRE